MYLNFTTHNSHSDRPQCCADRFPGRLLASGNYLIQGEVPRRRTLTTFQYGRPFEFREGDPIPSERELRSLIRDHMTRKYNASDVDVLKLVHWK